MHDPVISDVGPTSQCVSYINIQSPINHVGNIEVQISLT